MEHPDGSSSTRDRETQEDGVDGSCVSSSTHDRPGNQEHGPKPPAGDATEAISTAYVQSVCEITVI